VQGEEWREGADGLSGRITKLTVKCETVDYNCSLRSLELAVFKRRNGAICFKLALALRNLSLETAM
jgi:hypothetical protein